MLVILAIIRDEHSVWSKEFVYSKPGPPLRAGPVYRRYLIFSVLAYVLASSVLGLRQSWCSKQRQSFLAYGWWYSAIWLRDTTKRKCQRFAMRKPVLKYVFGFVWHYDYYLRSYRTSISYVNIYKFPQYHKQEFECQNKLFANYSYVIIVKHQMLS